MSGRSALRFQLSLMQAIKLVVFCAAAFACVAPIVRQWQLDGSPWTAMSVVTFSAVAVPLVWVTISFVLVPRSLWRDRFVLSLLLCSVSTALAAAAWILCMLVSETLRVRSAGFVVDWQEMIRDLALVGVVAIALAGAVLFLATCLVRKFRSEAAS